MTLYLQTETVDARDLSCPMPIVKAAGAFRRLPSGAVVEVLATDAGSVKDFEAWTRTTGNVLLSSSHDAGVYRFVIQKK